MRISSLAVVLNLLVAAQLFGQDPVLLRIAGWNLEGNGDDIDPDLLESQLAEKEDVDIWGLSEVRPNLFDSFREGAASGEGSTFGIVEGSTGDNIRLAIVFDESAVELLESNELEEGDLFDDHRAPLVAQFRGLRTGQEFLFVVNHLARGDAQARLDQAKFLNDWSEDQSLPVIAVGDYNMDFHVENGDFGDRDPAFDEMIADGEFEWLRPPVLVKTQAAPQFRTVLDFVFIANADPLRANGWTGTSRILEREGDTVATEIEFDDSDRDTDHRPVDAIFTLATAPVVPPDAPVAPTDDLESLETRELVLRLLHEVESLRAEVEALRQAQDKE